MGLSSATNCAAKSVVEPFFSAKRRVIAADMPSSLRPVPGGLAFGQIQLPEFLFDDETFLISVGKMKVHFQTHATLTTKNAFGLPPIAHYLKPGFQGRLSMHDRSISQTIVDHLKSFCMDGYSMETDPAVISSASQWDPVTVTVEVHYEDVSWLPMPRYLKENAKLTGSCTLPKESENDEP